MMISQTRSIADKRILIVEDCEEQALLLRNFFNKEGCRTQLAENGIDAFRMMHIDKPDLVISDIMMPRMGGIDLCRAIKETPSLSDIPVILITASWEKKEFLGGLEAGADFYFIKPCNKEYLLSKVEDVFFEGGPDVAYDGIIGSSVDGEPMNGSAPARRGKIMNMLHSFYEISIQQNYKILEYQREIKQLRDQLKKASS